MQGQLRQPVDQVVSRLDNSSYQGVTRHMLKLWHKHRRGRYELIHLGEQRLSDLPSPIAQGLSRQLIVQVKLHLDISGSRLRFASEFFLV